LWLAGETGAEPHWQVLAPVVLQTVCVRHVPPGLDDAALSAHNLAIGRRINEAGRAYLTPSMLDGHQILRISIGAERTEREHVAALWDALRTAAAPAGVTRARRETGSAPVPTWRHLRRARGGHTGSRAPGTWRRRWPRAARP